MLQTLAPSPYLPVVCSTDGSKAVALVSALLFVVLWFILRGDFFYVLPCVILCFSVLLALRLPRLGKRELILVLFVCLFDLRFFGFVCFLFLCLGRAAVCDCGTPWTFLLPFFVSIPVASEDRHVICHMKPIYKTRHIFQAL